MSIRLDAINYEDMETLRQWRNELMQAGYVRQWKYLSEVDQDAWYEKIHVPGDEHIMLAIIDEKSNKTLGVVGLCYVDWIRKKAEASIYIGDRASRGKGYGKDALNLLIDYGFGKLGMHRIWAEIFENNETSKALFENVGFIREGTWHDSSFHDGKWVDSGLYYMLFDQWNKIRTHGLKLV
ncbi:MAG: GNAT family protein [Patescibacteria group bacterium]